MSGVDDPPIVYGGPSLFGIAPELLKGFEVRPPVRRGDLDASGG